MVEGWFSIHSWEDNPLINGNPKVVKFILTFEKVNLFTVISLVAVIVKGLFSFHS